MKDIVCWVLLLAVAAIGMCAYSSVASDCDARAGVLVRDYSGLPRCVAAPPKASP